MPYFWITLPKGSVYNENILGPIIDPCGTPYNNSLTQQKKKTDQFQLKHQTDQVAFQAKMCRSARPMPNQHILARANGKSIFSRLVTTYCFSHTLTWLLQSDLSLKAILWWFGRDWVYITWSSDLNACLLSVNLWPTEKK